MAGWALFAGIAAAIGLLLWRLRFPRGLRNFALAAVMLGAAGYAWQGHPGWAGVPVRAQAASIAIDDETLALRSAMFGRYGTVAAILTPADAMMRYGAPDAAAKMIQGGINREPDNVALWTQLGVVIAARDKQVSPAALFAFRRASRIGPAEPAPWFFLGLAQVRAGEFVAARRSWARALALTPAEAGYRGDIALRLGLLDRLLAQGAPDAR